MELYEQSSPSRKYRWLSVVVGIIFIIVGVWCLFTPASTVAALTLLFIAGFFAAGFFELCIAFTNIGSPNWGWRLACGLIDILLGIWLCAMPAAQAATVLIWVVGFYVFFYSALGIGEACQLRKISGSSWGWMLFFGIVGVICSFVFLLSPVFGAIYLTWLAGLSFISYGLFRCLA